MRISFSLLVAVTAMIFSPVLGTAADSWPQWRGASQNGVAAGKAYPRQWSAESGIAWQRELPGRGGSTPVIDGKTAYLTSGVAGKNTLLAIDTSSGKTHWEANIGQDTGGKHQKGSGSNPSAVVDGDLVFAYFRSGDLGCVNRKGEVLWQTNLQDKFGEDTLWWDLGSSPTVTESAVVVVVMQTGPSYLVAFDKKSGDQLWKVDRNFSTPAAAGDRYEASQSYATPLAVQVDGKEVIAVMGADHLTLHSADNGKELGRLGGFNPRQEQYWRSISSPVAQGNIIVCPYARGETITGVRMDQLIAGKGTDAIAWHRDGLGSDVPTPAAVDGRVYVVGDKKARGLVTCLDIESGETIWQTQLKKSRIDFSSSPLIAGDHLYVTSENATTYVVGPLSSDQPDVVAVNELDDTDQFTVASPVPVGDGLLIRSRHKLYRLAGK